MKRKGFTLIELLVVISIIALLMAILMPALVKVRQLAQRVVCGSNCKGIGTAMNVYANDGDGKFPTVHALNAGSANPEMCLFLLVRGEYTTPGQFVCRGNTAAKEDTLVSENDWKELTNFHSPTENVSYSYHCPVPPYLLSQASDPRLAVVADRNPFLDVPTATIGTGDYPYSLTSRETIKYGNSNFHERDGQNVLFVDNSVSFEREPFCAADEDNVYTVMSANDETGRKIGTLPTLSSKPFLKDKDSVLLNTKPAN